MRMRWSRRSRLPHTSVCPNGRHRLSPPGFLPLLLFFLGVSLLRADLIVLRDGHEYDGTLLQATDTEVVFQQGAEVRRYPRSEVVHVRLQTQREWAEFEQASAIPDPILKACLAAPVDAKRFPPGAGTVTLYDGTTVRLETASRWRCEHRAIVRILSEHGEQASVREVLYRKGAEAARIRHGISIRADGTLVHLRDTAVQDESVHADLPRYDRLGRLRFALPEGKVGVILDAATEVVRTQDVDGMAFADEFRFGGQEPALDLQVAVFVPAGVELVWAVVNDPEQTVKHEESADAGGVWHRWRRTDSPQLLAEPIMPPWSDVVPRLVVSARRASWVEIAAEFEQALARLEARYPTVPEPPAREPEALWDLVSRQVQPLSVSLAATGYLPGDPGETWRLRGGAALDRTYLLYRWLKAAGVANVHWVWIRPRSAGRLVRDVPTLNAFVVPGVRLGDEAPLYLIPGGDLDTAAEVAADHAGAPCLVAGRGEDALPLPAPELTGQSRRVVVELDDSGDADVVETVQFRGAEAKGLREWRRLTEDEIRNVVQQRVREVDPRATHVRHRVLGDVARNAPELSLELTYRIPGLGDRRPALCSLLPPWLDFDARVVGRDRRLFGVFWLTPRADEVSVEVRFPSDLQIRTVPEPQNRDATVAQLVTAVEREPDRFRYTIRYSRPTVEGPVEAYAPLKECLETRAAVGRQYWVWRQAKP